MDDPVSLQTDNEGPDQTAWQRRSWSDCANAQSDLAFVVRISGKGFCCCFFFCFFFLFVLRSINISLTWFQFRPIAFNSHVLKLYPCCSENHPGDLPTPPAIEICKLIRWHFNWPVRVLRWQPYIANCMYFIYGYKCTVGFHKSMVYLSSAVSRCLNFYSCTILPQHLFTPSASSVLIAVRP